MAQVLIVGYGNQLRGDDGLGWQAAHLLAKALREVDVDIITCHQLTPELAEPVSRAALAIFIDAALPGPAGRLVCRPVTPELVLPGAFSHYLTPAMLLACARVFCASCPEAFLLSVSGDFFGFGERLSAPVQAALPRVVADADLDGRSAAANTRREQPRVLSGLLRRRGRHHYA